MQAMYEMQVEQYQERVQKYVERTIEREKLEPRPDTTAALIRIEKSWNHDDGCEVDEASPTYEWEKNDANMIDVEPERRTWSSMTSLRRGEWMWCLDVVFGCGVCVFNCVQLCFIVFNCVLCFVDFSCFEFFFFLCRH